MATSIIVKGGKNFIRTNKTLNNMLNFMECVDLNKYGIRGVKALKEATPKDSGETANSWRYMIVHDEKTKRYIISWYNDNIENGFPVAVMLQYGHATNNGGYVKGRDYINPSLQPIFDDIADQAWKEVIKIG